MAITPHAVGTILVIALSLALDALSVSIAGGLSAKRASAGDALRVALFFGVFQGVMPLIGSYLGSIFASFLARAAGPIAFALLGAIGGKMIFEAFHNSGASGANKDITRPRTLLVLAVATSIDALIVGLTLPLVHVPPLLSALIIGVVTFALSFAGFVAGRRIGGLVRGPVEAIGGAALALIGLKLWLG